MSSGRKVSEMAKAEIEQVGLVMFRVRMPGDRFWHRVDMASGECSCAPGRVGAYCEHIEAVDKTELWTWGLH